MQQLNITKHENQHENLRCKKKDPLSKKVLHATLPSRHLLVQSQQWKHQNNG